MILLSILLYIVVTLVTLILLIFIGNTLLRSPGYRGPLSDHFNGNAFYNSNVPTYVPAPNEPDPGSFLGWILSRKDKPWQTRDVHAATPAARIAGSELIATFINHATVLIQTQGLNIITDPVYSYRASPFSFIGPHRYTKPGINFDDLPKIDIIVISHNHYDHLDLATLKRLITRDAPRIIVPLGNKQFLKKHGIESVELDWWQSDTHSPDMTITSVPAQHFSARALSDRNKTLWSGYVVSTADGDIYFAGDTGFGPFVDQIAQKYPNGFRLGLLPIGAYLPRAFMRVVHISPEEAFEIQDRLNIREVLAIHFGTFKLASDGQDEPAERVRELSQKLPDSKRFQALPNGSVTRVL